MQGLGHSLIYYDPPDWPGDSDCVWDVQLLTASRIRFWPLSLKKSENSNLRHSLSQARMRVGRRAKTSRSKAGRSTHPPFHRTFELECCRTVRYTSGTLLAALAIREKIDASCSGVKLLRSAPVASIAAGIISPVITPSRFSDLSGGRACAWNSVPSSVNVWVRFRMPYYITQCRCRLG